MPCHNPDHNHEWPSTGNLTIFACETTCYLCDSTKEYKPASALRKHVQTHIKNDKLPLSLLRSASGRPKLSTRGFNLHRQTAVVQSPTPEQEPQDTDSARISSAQQVIEGPPVEQYAQRTSDTFGATTVHACTASSCYAFFYTSAQLLKHLHESHRASPDGPTLSSTTAVSSILRLEQPWSASATELVTQPNVPGVNSVEETHPRTTPAEVTHDYMQTHSPDESVPSLLPLSSRGYDSLRSPPSSGPVHRKGDEYMKVGLREVQQGHLASITPTIDSVQNTVSDDRTVATSYEIPLLTHDLSGSHLHHKTCWRCSMLSAECCLIDQGKACDECDYGGTALLCFGFRLEHLVDQMLHCIGEFPRLLRWKVGSMSSHIIISFSDCEKVQRLPSIFTLKKMKTDPWRSSWFFHDGWVEAFCNVVDAACQYRDTNFRKNTAIEKGLRCLDICVWMLWAIVHDLKQGIRHRRDHGSQSLNRSDLTDFLSKLFDTTIAKPSSERKEQLLDVFYGTLIVDHDPTFLDGSKSQLYQPMLQLLEYSMSTFQGADAHYLRAAAAVNPSTFGPSAPLPLASMSMYSHALCFIDYFSVIRNNSILPSLPEIGLEPIT